MIYEHTQEAMRDALEMESNALEVLEHISFDEAYAMQCRINDLEDDCMTMALRLLGEDFDTFAPETREVMERWGRKAYEELNREIPA